MEGFGDIEKMTDILRNQIKVILFLSSYTFLFIILMIQNYTNLKLLYFLGGLIVVSNLILGIVIKRCKSLADSFVKIKSLENRNSLNTAYLVTYIIPFLNINFSEITDSISLLLLFVIVGFLYIKSDMVYVNPMLNLFHFNLLKVEDKENNSLILITKSKERKILEKTKFKKITNSIMVG